MIACLICGEETHRTEQPWRIVDLIQPPDRVRPPWEPALPEPEPGDDDYATRLDGYIAHLACLRRVVAADVRDDPILRQSSR